MMYFKTKGCEFDPDLQSFVQDFKFRTSQPMKAVGGTKINTFFS